MLGWGEQRLNRTVDATYDRSNSPPYMLALYADKDKPVVHVWRVG